MLPRYMAWKAAQGIEKDGSFSLYPPLVIRIGDADYMRAVADLYPSTLRVVTGGLQLLQPIVFVVPSHAPRLAVYPSETGGQSADEKATGPYIADLALRPGRGPGGDKQPLA